MGFSLLGGRKRAGKHLLWGKGDGAGSGDAGGYGRKMRVKDAGQAEWADGRWIGTDGRTIEVEQVND